MTSTATLLLVDDEPAVLEIMRHALQAEGFEVTTAASGSEAMARMKERLFDLVVLDLIMPEKDGIQTLLELRALEPGLPVIVMSGGPLLGGGDFLPLARQLGARAALRKPFLYHELMDSVRGALGAAA